MNTHYCPRDPADTSAFQIALDEHREYLLELLLGAYALHEVIGSTIDELGPVCVELPIEQIEIALGCGSDAAVVCAKMSELHQADTGRWLSKTGNPVVQAVVPQNLLESFTHSLAATL